jgi:hypothetical protein
LFKDLDYSYSWTNKQILFEARLPYDSILCETFANVLPKNKFIPAPERLNEIPAPKYGLIEIKERSMEFKDVLGQIKKKLHMAQ